MAESRESRGREGEMGIIVPLKFQTFCPIISHLIVTAERTAPSPLGAGTYDVRTGLKRGGVPFKKMK